MLFIVCFVIVVASVASGQGPAFQWQNRPQLVAFTFEGSLRNSNDSLALLSQFSNGRLACSQFIPATWFANDCTSELQNLQSNHFEIGAFSDDDALSQSNVACLRANATVDGLLNRNMNGSASSSGFQYTMLQSPAFMWPFIESDIVRIPFTNPTSVALVAENYQGARAPIVVSISSILQSVGPDITDVIMKQLMSLDEIVAVTTGQLSLLSKAKSAAEAESIVNLCRSVSSGQGPLTNGTALLNNSITSVPTNLNKTPMPSPLLPPGSSSSPVSTISIPIDNAVIAGINATESNVFSPVPSTPNASAIPSNNVSSIGQATSDSPSGNVSGANTTSTSPLITTGIISSGNHSSDVPGINTSTSPLITTGIISSGNHSSDAPGINTSTSPLPSTGIISSGNHSSDAPGINTSTSPLTTTGIVSSGNHSSDVPGINTSTSSNISSIAGTGQISGTSIGGIRNLTGTTSVIEGIAAGNNGTALTPAPTVKPAATNGSAVIGSTPDPNIIGQAPGSGQKTDPATGDNGNDSSSSSSSTKSTPYAYVIGIGGGLCAMAVAIVYKVFKREDRFPPVITSGYVFESEDRGIYDLEACNDSVRADSEGSRENSSSYVHSELESVSTKS